MPTTGLSRPAPISVMDREEVLVAKMQTALGEVVIEGIDTNVDYQYEILKHPDYIDGKIDIEFIERLG